MIVLFLLKGKTTSKQKKNSAGKPLTIYIVYIYLLFSVYCSNVFCGLFALYSIWIHIHRESTNGSNYVFQCFHALFYFCLAKWNSSGSKSQNDKFLCEQRLLTFYIYLYYVLSGTIVFIIQVCRKWYLYHWIATQSI